MADVFVSYARTDEATADSVANALRAEGFAVWRDDQLPAHRAYSEVIEERLKSAKAVVVLWSAEAAKSQWVRAEADSARTAGILVQAALDGIIPPLPFNQIQCADLTGWDGSSETPGWRKLKDSLRVLVGQPKGSAGERPRRRNLCVCVLPFQNMSGDSEQEYFSDGISEDITTDLSQISTLGVVARNTAFTFKGQSVDVKEVAKTLGVTYVLEGSVRKAGNRVRITAQLIDGAAGDHVWADRYDRDLDDIFAIQDEISKAIVDALKIKLLPEEKEAIENRGTTNADAYNLYLMARQQWISGAQGNPRREEAIVRLCQQAVSLDPNYGQAWALMGFAQLELRFWHGKDENALPAAEHALAINPKLPEALCIKARYLEEEGHGEDAQQEIKRALALDPESWEVNREAARMLFRHGHFKDAVPYFEKAASLMDSDWHNPLMLVTCYKALGEKDLVHRAAKLGFERAERAVGRDPTDGPALAAGANTLAVLGDKDRALEWIRRALFLDPDNLVMRYNLGCALIQDIGEFDEAVETFQPFFEKLQSPMHLRHLEVDPDIDPIRENLRFKEMLASAKQRLGVADAVTDA
jgi:adenylate cyclase